MKRNNLRVVITGASSGIGTATAIAFAREGADIALAYHPDEESDARRIIELVEAAGRKAVPLPGDLTDAGYCRQLVADAVDGLDGLDTVMDKIMGAPRRCRTELERQELLFTRYAELTS